MYRFVLKGMLIFWGFGGIAFFYVGDKGLCSVLVGLFLLFISLFRVGGVVAFVFCGFFFFFYIE